MTKAFLFKPLICQKMDIPSFSDLKSQIIFDKHAWQNTSFFFTQDVRARVFKHLRSASATRTRAISTLMSKIFCASLARSRSARARDLASVLSPLFKTRLGEDMMIIDNFENWVIFYLTNVLDQFWQFLFSFKIKRTL